MRKPRLREVNHVPTLTQLEGMELEFSIIVQISFPVWPKATWEHGAVRVITFPGTDKGDKSLFPFCSWRNPAGLCLDQNYTPVNRRGCVGNTIVQFSLYHSPGAVKQEQHIMQEQRALRFTAFSFSSFFLPRIVWGTQIFLALCIWLHTCFETNTPVRSLDRVAPRSESFSIFHQKC